MPTGHNFKRGDIHPETGLFFWGEIVKRNGRRSLSWVTAEKLAERRAMAMRAVRRWQAANPTKVKECSKRTKSRPEFKARANILMQAWKRRNRPKVNADAAKSYRTDPLFRLRHLTRTRFLQVIRQLKAEKPCGGMAALGCSLTFLRAYLETRFQPGMTWENHGPVWHIDHVIPLASAKTAKQAAKLCHYTNLQPLWAAENIRKHAKKPTQLQLV